MNIGGKWERELSLCRTGEQETGGRKKGYLYMWKKDGVVGGAIGRAKGSSNITDFHLSPNKKFVRHISRYQNLLRFVEIYKHFYIDGQSKCFFSIKSFF